MATTLGRGGAATQAYLTPLRSPGVALDVGPASGAVPDHDAFRSTAARAKESRRRLAVDLDLLALQLDRAFENDELFSFADAIEGVKVGLHIADVDIAGFTKVSRPTVGRWIRGEAVPHRLVRNAIYGVLAAAVKAEAKKLRD